MNFSYAKNGVFSEPSPLSRTTSYSPASSVHSSFSFKESPCERKLSRSSTLVNSPLSRTYPRRSHSMSESSFCSRDIIVSVRLKSPANWEYTPCSITHGSQTYLFGNKDQIFITTKTISLHMQTPQSIPSRVQALSRR